MAEEGWIRSLCLIIFELEHQSSPALGLGLRLELTPLALQVLRLLDPHWNCTNISLGLPACQLQIWGLHSLHNQVRQFLIVNPFCLSLSLSINQSSIYLQIYLYRYLLYISYLFFFSGEPRLTHTLRCLPKKNENIRSTQILYTNDNWVGGRRKREGIWGYMCTYSWFTLLYSRN